MRLVPWLLGSLVSVCLVSSGCGSGESVVGGKDLPKIYRSAASLSPGATEILMQKTTLVNVIGRTASCNYPIPDMKQPVIVNGVKPNYELIAKLSPGLIVYDVDMYSEAEIAKFKELGIDTFAIEGNTVEEYIDCLYRLGAKTRSETNMAEYASLIQGKVNTFKGVPLDPKPKVAVMMAGKGAEHMIAGLGSFQADVVRCAGGEPVGPDAKIFVPVSAETLVRMNPDAIIATGDALAILNDPRLQSIAAIKNKRVGQGNGDIILRRGVRLQFFISEVRSFIEPRRANANAEASK